MSQQTIADKVIDALGGTSAVATLCEITTGAVSQWRDDGIPKPRLMFLKLARPDLDWDALLADPQPPLTDFIRDQLDRREGMERRGQ